MSLAAGVDGGWSGWYDRRRLLLLGALVVRRLFPSFRIARSLGRSLLWAAGGRERAVLELGLRRAPVLGLRGRLLTVRTRALL